MSEAVVTVPKPRLDLGKVLLRAVQAFRANFVLLTVISLVFGVMPQIVTAWFLGYQELFVTTTNGLSFLVAILSMVILGLGGVAMTAGVSFAVIQSIDGTRPTLGACLQCIGQRYFGLLVLTIIMNIGIGLGLILLIVPGIFLSVIWSVAAPAFVAEHHPGGEALGRSDELIKGNRWLVFALMLVAVVIQLLVGFAGGALEVFLPLEYQFRVITPIMNVILNLIWMVIFASLFVALRDAKEGPKGRLAEIFD